MSMTNVKGSLASQWKVLALSAVAALVAAAIVSDGISNAQVTKGKERPLTTKQWMQAVHKVHCGAIKEGLDAGPTGDEAWEAIALHAALMNESSHVLMADGRCPDGVWADACKTLGKGSSDILQAVTSKDVDAAKTAFGAMTQSCGGCHKAHKK